MRKKSAASHIVCIYKLHVCVRVSHSLLLAQPNHNRMSSRSVVNLDDLLQQFSIWQESMSDLIKENTKLKNKLKGAQKQCGICQQRVQDAAEESTQLRETIDRLHSALEKRCNFSEQNQQLREQIDKMTRSAIVLEQKHKEQMEEALESLDTLRAAHRKETAQIQESIKEQMQNDIEMLERTLQDKVGEIRQLQKENAELERAKHTEVVKLRLEYDAKMLKLQKQRSRSQTAHVSSVNNEIFRKKLQHVKAESDHEITSLKRKIQELETQVQRQGQTNSLATKRRRVL